MTADRVRPGASQDWDTMSEELARAGLGPGRRRQLPQGRYRAAGQQALSKAGCVPAGDKPARSASDLLEIALFP